MARMRIIKPSFFTNDILAELDPLTRLLFVGLWTCADRDGRLEDRPKRIKAEVLPFDDGDVDAMLADLHAAGFIQRYAIDGYKFIQILQFGKHQRPHHKEAESTIPAPTQVGASTKKGKSKHQPRSVPAPTKERASTSGNLELDNGNVELGNGENASTPDGHAAGVPTLRIPEAPPVLTFPIVGRGCGASHEWHLTGAKLAEYAESFPGVDVLAECRKARQWTIDNRTKRKTSLGMPAFLTRWLSNAQNRGGGQRAGPAKPDPFAWMKDFVAAGDETVTVEAEVRA